MGNAHAAERPRFRLRWLFGADDRNGGSTGNVPSTLTDDDWVPPGERVLYDRVKHALSATLRATDREGVVLLPAYVPGGVVWAVLNAGFEVRYYPVNADLSLPVGDVIERIKETAPAAMLFVHYFGFVDDRFDDIASVVRERDVLVVEDCARGAFGRDADGRLLGSTGDVALFCLHKTLPVPNGGLVIAGHSRLPRPEDRRSERGEIPRLAALAVARRMRIPLNATPSIDRAVDADLESVASGRS